MNILEQQTANRRRTWLVMAAFVGVLAMLGAGFDLFVLGQGEFYSLIPPRDDIHYVKTVSDVPSVSIHLLANDTACVWRHRFDPVAGTVQAFRSGYSNAPCPGQ